MSDPAEIRRWRDNLRDELDGAALYAALADVETDKVRRDLFLQLSQAEAEHAQVWREKLEAAGISARPYTPGFRTRTLSWLAKRFGPRFVLPTVAAFEFADRDKYAGQFDAAELSSEERGHAAVAISHFEFSDIVGRGTELGLGLDANLVDASKLVEIVDVTRAKIRLHRGKHGTQRDIEQLDLFAVDIDI